MFHPRALLFVGVAGALSDGVQLGDVVVATRVYAVHGGREDDTGFHTRPRAWDAPHELEQLARVVSRSQWWAPTSTVPGVEVHFKPIAAGEVVLNSRSSALADQLRWSYNDAAAIEMEGAGVAQAGHLSGMPVLTIRGISYRADGTKHATDGAGWQTVAVANAAAFAVALCREIGESAIPDTEPAGDVPSRSDGGGGGHTQHVVASSGGTAYGALGGDIHVHDSSPGRPAAAETSGSPEAGDVRWRSCLAVAVPWRTDRRQHAAVESAFVELHLVPVSEVPLVEVRRLPNLADQLAEKGRSRHLFGVADSLDIGSTGSEASAVGRARDRNQTGVVVRRDGARSGWTTLPHDGVGSLLDTFDLTNRLTMLLSVLVDVGMPSPPEAVPVVGIEPVTLLAEGEVSSMPRSRATWPLTRRDHIRTGTEECVPWRSLTGLADDVVAELVARVLAEFRSAQ
jgi:nucleoside phosphorylase